MNNVLATERTIARETLIIAIQALSDALYKNERMGDDDEIGVRNLKAGAWSARAILKPFDTE